MKALLMILVLALSACSEAPKSDKTAVKTHRVSTDEISIALPVILKAEEIFNLEVTFASSVSEISGKLTGVSMDMGRVPVMFEQTNAIDNRFIAQILLGACALPTMQWRLEITWHVDGQTKYFDQLIMVSR